MDGKSVAACVAACVGSTAYFALLEKEKEGARIVASRFSSLFPSRERGGKNRRRASRVGFLIGWIIAQG